MQKVQGLVCGVVVALVSSVFGSSSTIDGGGVATITNSWDAGFDLTVGKYGSGNTLNIIDGGTVFDGLGTIGEHSTSDNNTVLVSGSGSSWSNVSDLVVGNEGSGNVLTIENGGLVYNANGVVGLENGSDNNAVIVTGAGSTWDNSDTLMVGRKGDFNSLTISDGATVNSSFGAIGFEDPAFGNNVLVTGAGSIWKNSGDLMIGAASPGDRFNRLAISSGGKVVVGGQLAIYDDLYLNNGGWLTIAGHADLETSGFHYNAGSTLEVAGSVWFDGFVEDNNTLIFQGSGADWLGEDEGHYLHLGFGGNSNSVIISNQADIAAGVVVMTNDNNLLQVSGAGSKFEIVESYWGGSLYLGADGSGNEFRVEDGASALMITGYVGYVGINSTNPVSDNRIVVDGPGSQLTASGPVYINYNANTNNPLPAQSSIANYITVQNGGSFSASELTVGYAGGVSNRMDVLSGASASLGNITIGQSNGMHNAVLVDGSNTAFSSGTLVLGNETKNNSFTVTGGAQAISGGASLGVGSNSVNNTVLVSGTNSLWNAGSLTIGDDSEASSMNNTLTIENGGIVEVSDMTIATNGTGNELNLNAGGWLKVSSDMNAKLDGFHWGKWSTLEVQGNLTNMEEVVTLSIPSIEFTNSYGVHDGQNTLILSGGGMWTNNCITVGEYAASNRLELSSGGYIENEEGWIGRLSDFNQVDISGGGFWSNHWDFTLGEAGSDNLVNVGDGGLLFVAGETYIGLDNGAVRNQLIVSGNGAHLYNKYDSVFVGVNGAANSLSVTNGGLVTSAGAAVGLNSDGNKVLIEGTGSSWDNYSDLSVGYFGDSNEFTVAHAGSAMVHGNTFVGNRSGSEGNSLYLDGSESLLQSGLNVHIGRWGTGNRLSVLNGAQLYDDIGLLGTEDGADNNHAIVEGPNSLWYNKHTFFAGNSGSSNLVEVRNGGELRDTTGYIGYHQESLGNKVVVDDAIWQNSDGVFVGFNGSGNSLVITNGGRVVSGESRIGAEAFADDNLVEVSGAGSEWIIGKALLIGNGTNSGNRLVVENGGGVVVKEDIAVGAGSYLDVNDGGTLSVYGDTVFSDWFTIASGGTLETYGGISGLGGVLGSGSTLQLLGPGASWHEDESILLEGGAILEIGSGALVSTPSNFTQQANATVRFGVSTNSTGGPLAGHIQVGQVANLEGGANIAFASEIGALGFDQTYTNTLLQADLLVVAGQTNGSKVVVDRYLNPLGSLLGVSLLADNREMVAIINRITLGEGLNVRNQDLLAVLEEIDALASNGDPLANRQLGIINGLSSEKALAELTQFYTRGIPTYEHMSGIVLGMKQIDKRSDQRWIDKRPDGVSGPDYTSADWSGWISAYGNQATMDDHGGFSGYDLGTYGTVVGIDTWFEQLLVGFAGGMAKSSIEQNDGDNSDADTIYGAIYSVIEKEEINLELECAFGNSSIENDSGTVFGSESDFDASGVVLYAGVSGEENFGIFNYETILGLRTSYYSQEGYDEVSENAIGRSVDSYDRWGIQSVLGGVLSNVKELNRLDLITRISASWQHEFNADEDTLDYTLIGQSDRHRFMIQAPVEDVFDLGISAGCRFKSDLVISLGIDGHIADEYSAIGYNGKIQYSF